MRQRLLSRHRDFRLFWGGQTLSVVGAQVTAVALPLVAALTLDAGAAGVSVVATASFLPNVVLPLVAGAWLERRPKRPTMVAADLVRAAALAVVPVAYGLDALSLPLLAAVAFVVGSASVFFDIGSFAYVPSLVDGDDLAAANRAMQGSATAAQVGCPSHDDFWPLGESNRVERRGLGRALVREALARAGGLRIDLLSRSGSYYLSLGAESVPGFRLHKETMA